MRGSTQQGLRSVSSSRPMTNSGLARAYETLGWAENARNRFGAETVARKLAYAHAKLAGDPVMELEFMAERTSGISWGPMPVSDGLALCHEVLELAPNNRTIRGDVLHQAAVLEAMAGDLPKALSHYDESIAILRDLGGVVHLGFAAQGGWLIGWLSGDHQMAERETRWSCVLLDGTWREGPVRRESRPDGAGDLRTGPPRRGGAVGPPGSRGSRRPRRFHLSMGLAPYPRQRRRGSRRT